MKFDLFGFEINFKEKCFYLNIFAVKNIYNEGRSLFYFSVIDNLIELHFLFFRIIREF